MYARHQLRQLNKIAPIQWQIDNLSGVDHSADSRVFRLQQGRFAGDSERLSYAAEPESDVDAGRLIQLQNDLADLVNLKAFLGDGEAIVASRQVGKRIASSGIRAYFAGGVGGQIDGSNHRTRYRGACRVGNSS